MSVIKRPPRRDTRACEPKLKRDPGRENAEYAYL